MKLLNKSHSSYNVGRENEIYKFHFSRCCWKTVQNRWKTNEEKEKPVIQPEDKRKIIKHFKYDDSSRIHFCFLYCISAVTLFEAIYNILWYLWMMPPSNCCKSLTVNANEEWDTLFNENFVDGLICSLSPPSSSSSFTETDTLFDAFIC